MSYSKTGLIAVASLFFILSGINSSAQVAGPNSPTTYVISGSGTWLSNGAGFIALDNNMAYADLGAYPGCTSQLSYQCYYSQVAEVNNFLFSIPSSAAVNGIELAISRRIGQPVSDIRDSVVQLMKGGFPAESNYASASQWPMSFTYESYGDPADLWNTTWTPSDINSSGFGVMLQLTNGVYDQTAQIDHVQITVYYTSTIGMDEISGSVFRPVIDHSKLIFIHPPSIPVQRFCLFDNMSRKVVDLKNFSFQPLNISHLKEGVYFIRIETAQGTVCKKIVL